MRGPSIESTSDNVENVTKGEKVFSKTFATKMRMDASFYKNVEGLTFDHAIHKSEKSFLQKNDFASIKYFPVEKHSFGEGDEKKIVSVYDLSVNGNQHYYVTCEYPDKQYFGMYISKDSLEALDKTKDFSFFDRMKKYLVSLIVVATIFLSAIIAPNSEWIKGGKMDWLDSVIGSPSYSTDMELSYDAMVAKSQLRESTGQFKDVFKNGTMIINEDVSVKEAEAALFQKTETPEWNARIFEEMQRTMLGQQPKTASQSVVDMLTESIGKYERYTGSELKAKPMFFFSNIDSVTQDQTDNYTKAIKDIGIDTTKKYSFYEAAPLLDKLVQEMGGKSANSKVYESVVENVAILPKEFVDNFFIGSGTEKRGITFSVGAVATSRDGEYVSEGSKLYDFYGNEASAMLSSIGKSVNRYATKYEDKFNVQPDDIFSFTLPSNPITLPRLEAARNGLDTSVILTKLEQIKKENPEQFNAIEPLVGVDQGLFVSSLKIGDATNSKALADRYAQIFSLSKDAMEHSIEAGYNVKTRDYVKKMIPEINVDQTIHFDKKIDSPKGNDMVVSSQSLDTFMHEFAGHSLLEKSKVQGLKDMAVWERFALQNDFPESGSAFDSTGWSAFAGKIALDQYQGKKVDLGPIPFYSTLTNSANSAGTEWYSVMAPVFLKSPAYVEYVAKYGGENSQYFSEVANYVKKQLSVTMNIPASAWKKYEKQADDLHIAISKNMDKTISTSIKGTGCDTPKEESAGMFMCKK